MSTFGIVCEGPTDFILLAAIIDEITQAEDNQYFRLQPNDSMTGPMGNGWKGVWKWCEEYGPQIEQYMKDASPEIQYLIIQIDGDVSRKEKELHCSCERTICPSKGTVSPLKCKTCSNDQCPIELPCDSHENQPAGYKVHLRSSIDKWLQQNEEKEAIIVVSPCDSTDTWVVAAHDDFADDYEAILDPWIAVVTHGAKYHGIRIPGKKKNQGAYQKLSERVCDEWDKVTERCAEAARFDSVIRSLF